MKVLAIETSCDETAAAIVEGEENRPFSIAAQTVYSQIDLHRQFGGVYPEAASREHIKKIGPVIEDVLVRAKGESELYNQEWLSKNIDAICVTSGPGLIGSLLVGVNTAKTLAYSLNKPLIGIHHHEGHIMASWLGENIPELPAIALVVSGGHTQIIWMEKIGQYSLIGRTRDDAAGEAFDKAARLLGLSYPGGPQIGKLAATIAADALRLKEELHIGLPRPMLDSHDFDFSFSGLKTAVAQLVARRGELSEQERAMIAWEFQEAVVEVLARKLTAAVTKYKPKSVIVAGGVAANGRLREEIQKRIEQSDHSVPIHVPVPSLCTDNAAMIGAAGLARLLAGQVGNWYDVSADENMQLSR